MAQCRSCGATIKWIRTVRGKNMPCDPEPVSWDDVEQGDRLIGEDGTVRSSFGLNIDDDGMNWYMPHWTSCPQANDWRNK